MLIAALTAHAAPVVVTEEVAQLAATLATIDAATCAPVLDGVFDHLEAIDPARVDMDDVHANGPALVQGVWQARLALHDTLVALHADGPVPDDCITGFRRVDIATRYLVDHLLMEQPETEAWLTTAGFTGVGDLRSGDILVTRGAALSSAGIAHIGRIDSQFSHNAMIHVDADGKVWTIEAYLEKGGLVQPLEDFLHHGLGRIVVLRHDDAALAAKASTLAYERVAHGDPIDYDEAFRTDDDGEQLFCSEIGPWAFGLAGGPTDLPLHRTVFPRDTNPAMFDAMGIEGDLIAAPADLLFDPRFRILGEWRELHALEEMRRHDAVVEALFRWMEKDGYALDPQWKHRATVRVGLTVRRTPGLGRLVEGMVHPNGDPQFLVAGLALQEAGNRLWKDFDRELEGEEHPSYAEMHRVLEAIRTTDLEVWVDHPRRANVHRVVNPG
ncbi:MAG: hypothetical protein H6734_14555 [Alphaproteobacteria bacterium]|nr:hypothetical protein [Alphaproteobacteria bacterium]